MEESFGGPIKGSKSITKLVGLVTGASGPLQTHQHTEHVEYPPVEHKDQASPANHYQDSQHVHNHPPLNYNNHEHQQQTELHNSLPNQQETLHDTPNHQFAYEQIQSLLNPHLGVPINSAQNFKDQTSNYELNMSYESLKLPIHNNQNSLETGQHGGFGLPVGFGVPIHGLATPVGFRNWKRSAVIPRRRKQSLKKYQVHRAVDYWVKDSMLHRI